jgi:hypothetical protein
MLPLINRAPRNPRARAELTEAWAALLRGAAGEHQIPNPIFLLSRRRLDEVLRDGARFPDSWLASTASAVQALLERSAPGPTTASDEPVPVAPGSLGSWSDDHER